jgi:hypothetical protein
LKFDRQLGTWFKKSKTKDQIEKACECKGW